MKFLLGLGIVASVLASVIGPYLIPGSQPAAHVSLTTPPAAYVPLYQSAAGLCPGLPWQVLAAIHAQETAYSGDTAEASSAGAIGPMQFLPSTFARFSTGAITSLVDSVTAAALYLCNNGAGDPASLPGALWHYNHSWDYVDQVLARAQAIEEVTPTANPTP